MNNLLAAGRTMKPLLAAMLATFLWFSRNCTNFIPNPCAFEQTRWKH